MIRGGRERWGQCTRRWLAPATVALLALTGCGTSGGGVPPGGDGGLPLNDAGVPVLQVSAADNFLALGSCGVTPAVFANVAAGTYTITLASSSLSKGSTTSRQPSFDDYVVVHLPLPAGDPGEDYRFFMLNGVGDSRSITLPADGDIQVMFIDSDDQNNTGQGVVTLDPGSQTVTVSPTANVLAWQTGCQSNGANAMLSPGSATLTLLESTLSSGSGLTDTFVMVRSPSEVSQDDRRYVMLNGLDASATIQAPNGGLVRAWFISASGGGSGTADVEVTQ